jgi:PA14 domain-containing protein
MVQSREAATMRIEKLDSDYWMSRRSLKSDNRRERCSRTQQRTLLCFGVRLASEHQQLTPQACRSRDKHIIIEIRPHTRQFLRLLSYFAPVTALLAAACASAWITIEHRRLLRDSGLAAEYRAGAEWQGAPDVTSIDNGFSAALVRQRSRQRHGAAFTVVWRGYLLVPARDRYRFSVLADDRAAIEIDKRPLVEGDKTRREVSVELARGLHPITIRYYDGYGQQDLDLRWAKAYGPHDQIPRTFFVPRLISGEEAQRRIAVSRWASRLPFLWSLTVIGLAAAFLIYRCTFSCGTDRRRALQMVPIYVIAAIVFTIGISWGIPDYRGWAVDEISPGEVDDILDHRFATGWASNYPPVHFALLAAASVPTRLSDAVELTHDTLERYSHVWLINRTVSVGMALAILTFIYSLTDAELGHRAARFAVISVLVVLPLTYYAKTANVDVPYLFWVTASWVYYMRGIRSGSKRDACLFAATGAAAIATKDQAYGFYVLPAAHIVFNAFRSHADVSRPRLDRYTVFAMAGVFIAVTLILFNVPFNLTGVREHLRLIVGPSSAPFRMYRSTPVGYLQMLTDSVWQMGSAMSWPVFVIGIIGAADAIRSKTVLVTRLLLFAVSYFLTFIAVVMYHYDRFFIGICLVFAVAAGAWLDRWTRAGKPYRLLRLTVAGLALAYGAARVVSLDVMMLRDSRYFVEHWIIDRIAPGTRIAAEGMPLYLPRQAILLWVPVSSDPTVLAEQQPTFVILNPAYSARGADEAAAPGEFYSALADGRAGYRRVLSYRTHLWFSPLEWEPRFNGRNEDQFSNITKVNPTIEVYERMDSATPKQP